MELLAAIDGELDRLATLLAGVVPEQLCGPEAAAVVERGVRLERLGVALRTRFARRVTRTGAYAASGHKSAANWLAAVSGESVGQAQGVLEVATDLDRARAVGEAFDKGTLSLAQAKVAAGAAALDPSAQERLLHRAAKGSMKDLRDEAAAVRRRHFGEASIEAKEARVQRRRYCRTWTGADGGIHLDAWLPTLDGARVRSVLDGEADRIFAEARSAGRKEPADRYLADALVRVVCGETSAQPRAEVAIRVDAATLRRGAVEGDEVCEIPGIGPIPVAVAQDLLGDAFFHLVLTNGIDVLAVTSKKRTIPQALRSALIERDRTCAVPGCNATRHLQIDHDWAFAKGGPTELGNLKRLCAPHHKMKTLDGFRLVPDRTGELVWVGPP
ncbi:MAG TPA: HNH endonuclease signature motif containing protein [Acidimicrobiales bacterium]|jgi:hypothetical protein|nr:HNH endonuclease signature motif containing protein [Acidimicrobiales bacterium]